jgi:hypothetical protein
VDIESIALNTYFGVELFRSEDSSVAARQVCNVADEVKTLFRRLEVMDVLTIGGRRFARCRADLLNPYPMLDLVFFRGRAVIQAGEKGFYFVRFPGGRFGPVPQTTMHGLPMVGQRMTFRGPKLKNWESAFGPLK